MMLTLALTVVVPETVAPDAGDDIVTTRLPSCASAWSGTSTAPRTVDSSATRTLLMWSPPGPRDQLSSRNHVVGVDQDPGVRRRRVLAHDLDRQRVRSTREPARRIIGVLRPFGRGEGVELLDEDSVERYVRDPGLGPARADPADAGAGEGDGRLRAGGIGFGGRAFAVGFVAVVLSPARPIGDRRVGVLVANAGRDDLEGIDHDDGVARGRVVLPGDLDRDRVARVRQTACREDRRLDVLGRRIGVEVARHLVTVDEHVGGPGLRPIRADPGHRGSGEGEGHLRVRGT